MAVSQSAIKTQLKALYDDMQETEYTDDEFADAMATIIRTAILSATVSGTATGVTSGGASAPVTGTLT